MVCTRRGGRVQCGGYATPRQAGPLDGVDCWAVAEIRVQRPYPRSGRQRATWACPDPGVPVSRTQRGCVCRHVDRLGKGPCGRCAVSGGSECERQRQREQQRYGRPTWHGLKGLGEERGAEDDLPHSPGCLSLGERCGAGQRLAVALRAPLNGARPIEERTAARGYVDSSRVVTVDSGP